MASKPNSTKAEAVDKPGGISMQIKLRVWGRRRPTQANTKCFTEEAFQHRTNTQVRLRRPQRKESTDTKVHRDTTRYIIYYPGLMLKDACLCGGVMGSPKKPMPGDADKTETKLGDSRRCPNLDVGVIPMSAPFQPPRT